jgi:hypothetical protein
MRKLTVLLASALATTAVVGGVMGQNCGRVPRLGML